MWTVENADGRKCARLDDAHRRGDLRRAIIPRFALLCFKVKMRYLCILFVCDIVQPKINANKFPRKNKSNHYGLFRKVD